MRQPSSSSDTAGVELPPALPLTPGLSRMLRGCASLGAAAVGVGGLAYLAKASTPVPVGDMMHPGHTRPLRTAAELSSFLDTNVAAGKTVFVRWIASPK
jgi:hypothetical protein